MDGIGFPKPKKADRKSRKRLGHNEETRALKRMYRILVRPAYLAGLAAGQGRKRELPLCERCDANVALHVHHMAGRDGEMVIDHNMLAGLCPSCHEWVHANPKAATEEGWLISRHRSRCNPPGSQEEEAEPTQPS